MPAFALTLLVASAAAALVPFVAPEVPFLHSRVTVSAAIFLAYCVAYAVWYMFLWPTLFSPLRVLPYPPGGSMFMGHWYRLFTRFPASTLREWAATVPNEGLLVFHTHFNQEAVVLTSPKALAEVLVAKNYDFVKPPLFRAGIKPLLGDGILLAEGDEHKRQRKNLMPAFAYRHIKELYPVFWDKGREVTESMSNAITNDPEYEGRVGVIDASVWASRVTLDVLGVAGLGHDFAAIQNPENELTKCYKRVLTPENFSVFLGILRMVLPEPIMRRVPLKVNYQTIEARKLIRRVCQELIDEKRAKLEKASRVDKDILSVAIESGGFDDENLIDQLMTFLVAGHETVSRSMTWAAYVLCRYPEIQRRLREDVQNGLPAMSDSKAEITAADVDQIAYLHAVCNEVLRVYPPVSQTVRVAAVDTSILDTRIPKGTKFLLSPWVVNVSKELWGADGEEFNPERWMAKGHAKTGGAGSNYDFLTFLHGPRSCIGKDFAQAEFACLLASWVSKFEFHFADEGYELKLPTAGISTPKDFLVKLRVLDA